MSGDLAAGIPVVTRFSIRVDQRALDTRLWGPNGIRFGPVSAHS